MLQGDSDTFALFIKDSRGKNLNVLKNLHCNFIYLNQAEMTTVWFTVLPNVLIRPLNWCWRKFGIK